jgi:hypothetical protein
MARRKHTPGPATLIPTSVVVDLIRYEKNLLHFFSATNEFQRIRRIEKIVQREGHDVKVVAEFRGSDYGLPTTADRDKFMAFLKIINEDRAIGGTITNPVRFSGYRMVQELGVARTGDIYAEIFRWGQRMVDTSIMSTQIVYLASKKKYSDDTFHVFNNFRRSGSSDMKDENREEGYEVELAPWFIDNLNQRFVMAEDFNAYKLLKRPISKGVFGFLHLVFQASGGKPVDKDYEDLCCELGVKSYLHASKIKQTLGLALDELVAIKYLSQWSIHSRVMKKGYKIRLEAGSGLMSFINKNNGNKRPLVASIDDDRALNEYEAAALEALSDQGVMADRAKSLVQTYGADRVLDIVDYQNSQMKGNVNRVQNPAGLIIFSLENNLPIPVSFVTSRLRKEAQNKAKAADELRQRDAELRISYAEYKDAILEKEFAKRFTPAELQAKVQAIISEHGKSDEIFKRVTLEQRQQLALQLIKKEIRDEIGFPSLEEWVLGQTQFSLF